MSSVLVAEQVGPGIVSLAEYRSVGLVVAGGNVTGNGIVSESRGRIARGTDGYVARSCESLIRVTVRFTSSGNVVVFVRLAEASTVWPGVASGTTDRSACTPLH